MSSDNSYFAGLEFFAELFDDLASCLYIYDNPAYPHQISAVKFCTGTKHAKFASVKQLLL